MLLGVGVLELLLYRPRSVEAVPESRLSHERIVGALLMADVVKADPTPRLSYHGPPRLDDRGVTAVGKILPATVTWQQLRAKHERIASALDLPAHRLEITHEPEWSPSTVRLRVALGTPQPPTATLADRCDWSQPILRGEDARQRLISSRGGLVHRLVRRDNVDRPVFSSSLLPWRPSPCDEPASQGRSHSW